MMVAAVALPMPAMMTMMPSTAALMIMPSTAAMMAVRGRHTTAKGQEARSNRNKYLFQDDTPKGR
jgi:hypothetical protein